MPTTLQKLGIDGDYKIVIADNPDRVEITAAQELKGFFEKSALAMEIVPESQAKGDKRFFLGRRSNLDAVRQLDDEGKLQIGEVSPEDDGFHLKQIGDDFLVAGADPRGVLYGVYAFEDFLNDGAAQVLDIRKVPYYRKRGSALGYYHNRYARILEDDHFDEKIAYLSRLGINQWTSYDGFDFTLNKLVQSDIFPFQAPPVSEYRRIVRLISSICKKYGIDYYLQLWEPILPRLAGDLEKYPEEALGSVNRPWGDPKVDRTLCINSTMVQDHYRNMMKKLVREFPDVQGVFFYNMDGSTWMCTPELCDRCKIACQDSPPGEYNPWESQALLINVLAQAAHEDKPDFDFRFWGLHYHGGRFEKLMGAVQEYNSVAGNWNGSDRDIMIPDQAEPDQVFVLAQKATKERAIPQYAFFQFNNFESIPRSFPFPFHVCDSLKKFKNWGLKNIMEDAGPLPDHNSINAMVMKEFEWNPGQDPQEFLAALSVRQFGQSAGKLMVQAWQELEKALDVWNDMLDNPLSGSHFATSIGANDGLPRPILPGIEKSYRNFWEVLSAVEPHKAELYKKFSEPGFLVKMKSMCSRLAQASTYASQAVSAASGKEFIGICYYEPVDGRPSCRQYAELNWAPIAVAAQICQQRCNMLSAVFLLTDLQKAREIGDEARVRDMEKQYSELIRSDLIVQECFGELLMSFAEMRPSYTRTGLKDNEIADLLLSTRAKIDLLKKSIASGKYLVFEDMPKNERYHFCWA